MLVSIGRRAWYLERMQPYTKPRRKIIIGLAAALFIVITASLGGFYLYRTAWTNNFDVVLPGKVYRSAQPKGSDFARWTKAHGLKTVINLRGESTSADVANETAAAKQEGLELIHVRFSAMEIPSALQLRRLITALETAPKPILIHCHAGADRSPQPLGRHAVRRPRSDLERVRSRRRQYRLAASAQSLQQREDPLARLVLRGEAGIDVVRQQHRGRALRRHKAV